MVYLESAGPNCHCGITFIYLALISRCHTVWSDDDWLKKFSGKTMEEAESEAVAGESASTATQEVGLLIDVLFECVVLTVTGVCFCRLSLQLRRAE